MDVRELNSDQLEQLRDALHWQWIDEGKEFDEVTNEDLYAEFDGIYFVEDDFWR